MIQIENRRALEIFGAQVETDLDAERGFLSVIKWPEDIESFSLEIWNFGLEQGINEEHFTNKAHQEWFIACKLARECARLCGYQQTGKRICRPIGKGKKVSGTVQTD